MCADGSCNAPSPGEIGNLLATQMTVVLVQEDSLALTKSGTGKGDVSSADRLLSCGSKCVSPYVNGSIVSLTAKPASGSIFDGWTGACAGTASTCTLNVAGRVDVGAIFTTASTGGGSGGGGTSTHLTLQVGRSNPGTVTAAPTGVDRALDCGNSCSAKFNAGTVVTLTATPPSGKSFVGWGGACSGTATVSMTGNLSAQANFSK